MNNTMTSTESRTTAPPMFDPRRYIRAVQRRAAAGAACPECGGPMVHGEGCALCPVCGFSTCN